MKPDWRTGYPWRDGTSGQYLLLTAIKATAKIDIPPAQVSSAGSWDLCAEDKLTNGESSDCLRSIKEAISSLVAELSN
jgi:hypothetical protein